MLSSSMDLNHKEDKQILADLSSALLVASTDTANARQIWENVYASYKLSHWAAFLKNPSLNSCLTESDLLQILYVIKRKGARNDNPENFSGHKVLMTIVRNQRLSGLLGCDYFLSCLKFDHKFAEYAVKSVSFIKRLTEEKVGILVSKLPDRLSDILCTLQVILKKDEARRPWTVNALKHIFLENPNKRKMLCLERQYPLISEILDQLFHTDVSFALSVLKDHQLCMFWLKTGQAYAHPLFTTEEYAELVAHYRFKPTISSGYRLLLNNELINKFGDLMLDGKDDVDKEELSQEFSTYLPSSDDWAKELENEDTVLITLVERSPTIRLSKKE